MADILIKDFVVTLFIFLRILSAFIAAPIFGAKTIPIQLKILLSALISLIVYYTLDTTNLEIDFSIWFLTITAFKEIITGLVLGFMLNLVFYSMQFAGTFIGFDMGLMMAQAMNPMEELSSTVMGEILYYAGMLIFLIINGHQFLIESLGYSFKIIPIGVYTVNQSVYTLLLKHSAAVFILAVKIASPILVSFFLMHLAEGVVARVIPQMQVFFVTQPLKLGLGFILLASGAPLYVGLLRHLLESYEYSLLELVRAMA